MKEQAIIFCNCDHELWYEGTQHLIDSIPFLELLAFTKKCDCVHFNVIHTHPLGFCQPSSTDVESLIAWQFSTGRDFVFHVFSGVEHSVSFVFGNRMRPAKKPSLLLGPREVKLAVKAIEKSDYFAEDSWKQVQTSVKPSKKIRKYLNEFRAHRVFHFKE